MMAKELIVSCYGFWSGREVHRRGLWWINWGGSYLGQSFQEACAWVESIVGAHNWFRKDLIQIFREVQVLT